MAHNESLISADLQGDERFKQVDFGEVNVRSVIGVPLRIEGLIIGSIILLNEATGESFGETDLAFLEILAVIAAPYLRNVQELKHYFESPLPDSALVAKYSEIGLIGKSDKFKEMLAAVEAATRSDIRVLLEGASGTGKELVARALRTPSARRDGPFVAIDCGAIPENLLESELFGHVRGAFTGAATARKGLLEEADRGTLFMDEIANLPLAMQSKLMRVLQEGEVRPLGGNQVRRINVRIIAAASTSLNALVEKGEFREDLFFRLHVYPIVVPTLDERVGDVTLLANHFLRKSAQAHGKQFESFHEHVLEFMKARAWRGNIRELQNFVERLVVIAPDDCKQIAMSVLPADIRQRRQEESHLEPSPPTQRTLQGQLEAVEERILRETLVACEWNQSRAARQLQLSERNMRFRMEKLDIRRSD